ncbi:MAG: DUF3488 and transglutaminase-like domain-containing protein, partial [Candidatus Hydrogenedentes bacterium]|nr:DUF3488 and transglutaminase-like domain-containing protein [Candidatus Hydrogenedentota bacterium]
MRSGVETRLKVAIAALVFVSYLGLTTTSRFGQAFLIVPVLAIAFMPIGEWLDRRQAWYGRITSAAIVLYILSIPILVQAYGLLGAAVLVVIFAQVYMIIHLKRGRNYGHVILMSFALVLAASVLSPRAGIGLVYLLFVLFTAWALSLLEAFSSQKLVAGKGGDFVRLEDPTARREPSDLARVFDFRTASMVLFSTMVILGMTTVLFFATPRIEAGFLGTSQASPQFTTGLAPEVDLTISGLLSGNATPVMRVQFPEEPDGRYEGPKLWRSTALDSYTGTSWKRRGLITQMSLTIPFVRRFMSDYWIASNEVLDRSTFGVGRLVYHEIFLDRPLETGVPALQMVKKISAGKGNRRLKFRWDAKGDFTVDMAGSTEGGIPLRLWSEVVEPGPELLGALSTDYGAAMDPSDLRLLTYHNLLPRTLALVEDLTEDAATAYDKVMAAHDWLRYSGGFVYSKEIPLLPLQNPVDAFILNEKTGHCELYASALALMVRSMGIPARVVSGYRGGVWDENDRSYTVTNDMAHLWVEVYFPAAGWIPFDPSPPQEGPALFSLDTLLRSYSWYLLKARLLWFSNVVSFSPENGSLLLHDTAFRAIRSIGGAFERTVVPDAFSLPDSEATLLTRLRLPLLIALPLACILFAAMLFLRRNHRFGFGKAAKERARLQLTPAQERAQKVRRLFVRRLLRLGVDCRGLTAEEMGQEVSRIALNDAASALEVLEAYSASRFGRRDLSETRFKNLCRSVRALKTVPSLKEIATLR